MEKRFLLSWIVMVILLSFLVAGCGGGGADSSTGGTGTVTGTVLAPDGTTPVVGATVGLLKTSEINSSGPLATTDGSGNFQLTGVPVGTQTLCVEAGSFEQQLSISVTEDATTTLTSPVQVAPIGKVGVVDGCFDDIETILTALNISFEYVDQLGITDPTVLDEYAIIFVNCDASQMTLDTTVLGQWVAGGGGLYVSDWAYYVVDQIFPNEIIFLKNPGIGQEQTVSATVHNSILQSALGSGNTQISFDMPSWVVMDDVAGETTVDVSGEFIIDYDPFTDDPIYKTGPLMAHFNYGSGTVYYTSFHNEANVTNDTLTILKTLVFSL